MSDVTQILNAIERGDAKAADELLPLVAAALAIGATAAMIAVWSSGGLIEDRNYRFV